MLDALQGRMLSRSPVILIESAFASQPPLQIEDKSRDENRKKLADAHMKLRTPVIKQFHSKFNKELMKARKQTLSKIERNYAPAEKSITTKAVAADFMFDADDFTDGLASSMRKASANALQTAGDQLFEELGQDDPDDPFTMPSQAAKEFLDGRENKITDCAQETFDEIKDELQEGIDEGDSTSALADRVRAKFNEISKGRAMTVASTETGAAYGVARQQGMEQAGIQFKEWLTSGLPTVRAAHEAAEGQTVAIDEPFHVGGEDLDHPGDPKGEADNVINCHCVSIAAKKGES